MIAECYYCKKMFDEVYYFKGIYFCKECGMKNHSKERCE